MLDKIKNLLERAAASKRLGYIKQHPEYQHLVQMTSFLPIESSVSRRLWHVYNKSFEVPKCKMCELNAAWEKTGGGYYRTYCSTKCAHNDDEVLQKTKDTNISKYGYSTPLQHPEIRAKIKSNWLKKYGVDNPSKNDTIKKEISKKLFIKKNSRHNQGDHIQSLIDQNLTQQQIGNELQLSQPRVSNLLSKLNLKTQTLSNNSSTQQEVTQYITQLYAGLCVVNDTTIIHPHHLDLVLPEKRIAFEINGVYWHSELNGKSRTYHLNKTNACAERGIQLIHLFDFEWNHKKPIVQSIIQTKLGFSSTIYARQCIVQEIDCKTADTFIEDNHLQGKRSAKHNIGLFFQGDLVAVMTFSRCNEGYEMIRFCCIKKINVVGGASKLFAYFVRTVNPDVVISFSDRRWNTGNVYKALGFEFVTNTAPNYWYFKINGDVNKIFSRVKFQKHKQHKLLEMFDPSKSEWENMQNNGYDRFWDCGSSKWMWKNKSPINQ